MHTFSSLVANTGCVKSTWVNVIKYTTFLRKVFLYKCSNYTLRPATILFMYSIQKLFIIAQFCSCQNVLLRSKVTRQTQQRALHILNDGNDVPLPHNHLHLHYKEKPRTKPSNNSQNRIHVQHSARGHKFFQPPKSATTAIRILKHKSASIPTNAVKTSLQFCPWMFQLPHNLEVIHFDAEVWSWFSILVCWLKSTHGRPFCGNACHLNNLKDTVKDRETDDLYLKAVDTIGNYSK